ncbi:sensitivity to red-light reduced protein [Mortierella claussenii]|nr:sensitivity to red-light reduced protein [Mortierella claussenii]
MSSPASSDSMSSSSLNSPTSAMSRSLPGISPPGSPPTPTLSMDSISGHSHQLDLALRHSQRKIKVMIVDDNAINLSILSRMLSKHFTDTVDLASIMTSGVDALETLSQQVFDLILMDIDMPVLTGVQTTTAIRNNTPEHPVLAENQYVPIIAVTTSDGQAQRELYQQVGMSDCVSKPISIPKLRVAIESAIKLPIHLPTG